MKTKLIAQLKEQNPNISKAQLSTLIEDVLSGVVSITHDEQKPFVFRGIGTFRPLVRQARVGRNPQTGEVIQLPEKHTVTLKLSEHFPLSASL